MSKKNNKNSKADYSTINADMKPKSRLEHAGKAVAKVAVASVAVGGSLYCAEKAIEKADKKGKKTAKDYVEMGALVTGYAGGIVVAAGSTASAINDIKEVVTNDDGNVIILSPKKTTKKAPVKKTAAKKTTTKKKPAAKKKTTKKATRR